MQKFDFYSSESVNYSWVSQIRNFGMVILQIKEKTNFWKIGPCRFKLIKSLLWKEIEAWMLPFQIILFKP